MYKPLKNLIVTDSGWNGSSGGRCITDFTKTVVFKKELTEKQLNRFRTYLKENKCPGWTGVTAAYRGNGEYTFFTTWDSSD